jgi:hypothetical protein
LNVNGICHMAEKNKINNFLKIRTLIWWKLLRLVQTTVITH